MSPSARGQYIIVKTDAKSGIAEEDETNNRNSAAAQVTPLPADLVVTSVQVLLPENRSGEITTIRYTVQNQGANPVWTGTNFWTDYLWISADGNFIQNRASWFGKALHSNAVPLQPGESYTSEVTATLPRGIGGNLYVYVHPNANDENLNEKMRVVQTGWWPADRGENDKLLDRFGRWAFEDPRNNIYRAPINVTYYEPDLAISNLQVPSPATSGQTINVAYTVTNQGTRATRELSWTDRVFLSKDPSLDRNDLYLGEFRRNALTPLGIGQTYTATVPVRLPDGIDGPFYILALTDSPASRDSSVPSDIGFNNVGVGFEEPYQLPEHDRLQEAARLLARGAVFEYQQEGNNTAKMPLTVVRAAPPDLRVTNLIVPLRVRMGQEFDVTYTVTNLGGDVPPSQLVWDDLVYLSRDRFLDLRADRFMDTLRHDGGLLAGHSYTVTRRLRRGTDRHGRAICLRGHRPVARRSAASSSSIARTATIALGCAAGDRTAAGSI